MNKVLKFTCIITTLMIPVSVGVLIYSVFVG